MTILEPQKTGLLIAAVNLPAHLKKDLTNRPMQLPDPILAVHPLTGAQRFVTQELLREVYLAPRAAPLAIYDHLSGRRAPWAESFAVAPSETTSAVEGALRSLVTATRRLEPGEVDLSKLERDSRLFRHMDALLNLWRDLDGALPDDLQVMRHVIASAPEDALEPLPVIDTGPASFASAAEEALRETLLAHHGAAPESASEAWRAAQTVLEGGAGDATSLGHLQRHLLEGATEPRPLDASLAFYGLRDHAEEAEFAAALVQKLIDEGAVTDASEIALLVSDESWYHQHLARAFAAAGVPLSGLPGAAARRDLAGEAVLHYLLCQRTPAPAMALASLYVSPLMPWTQAGGLALAREVMRGRFAPDLSKRLTGRAARLFSALREDGPGTGQDLAKRLDLLGECLTDASDFREEVKSARGQLARLRAVLGSDPAAEPEWEGLFRIATPQPPATLPLERWVEGVSVILDSALPWRTARHLIVLGFAGARYPRPAPVNPFFLDSELDALARTTGLCIPGRADILNRRLDMFRRQLLVAREAIHFLRPWRGGDGAPMSPCTGLSLVARTIQGIDEPDRLITDMHATKQKHWPCTSRLVEPLPTGSDLLLPRSGAIRLDRDLLALRQTEDGTPRPQSPSRLEKLLVSPLAWCLAEMGAEYVPWAPETWDHILPGTLAHDVLESLFPKGAALPDDEEIARRLPGLLASAIRRHAPFLQAASWSMERTSFAREVQDAARAWRDALAATGAEVLENEFWLRGEALGIRLNGRADCLLRLPDGRVLIVDHKKSSSGARRARMEAEWDLQLALYRAMLLRPEMEESGVLEAIRTAKIVGVAYHTLNDSAVLVHGLGPVAAGPFEIVEADISAAALEKLRERLAEVGAGTVRLNTEEDEGFFKNTAKLTPYAFDATPLVRAFLMPAPQCEDDDDA